MVTYKTIDEYLEQFDGEKRGILDRVRRVINENAPDAAETISYSMPTFRQGTSLIHFAAMKNHLGIYPTPEAIEAFADKLNEYKKSKGAIQFPWNKPIPYDLIGEITRYRVASATGR
jgi:uncharacterized protein YdhG (YjbR/CyaY superfamily)